MRMTIRNLPENTLYYVQLRTKSGENYSQYSQRFELRTAKDEIAPGPVINPSANFNDGNLTMAWEAPEQNADGTELHDLKDYKVTIGPIPADGNWPLFTMYVEGNRADFTKEMNIAAFGTFRANLVIHIQARDIVDNLSTFTPIEKIKQKPKPPVITSWASSGAAFSGTWTPPSQDVTNLALTDLAGYEVTVVYITNPGPSQILNKKVYNTTTPKFDYSYEQNQADFSGTARTPLTLEVRARDSVGQLSDPATAVAGNAIPTKVTGVTASAVGDGILVKWGNPPAADTDLISYNIYVASTSTGAGTLYGRVSSAHREYVHQTVAYGQPHHVYVTAVDEFLQESPASDRPASVSPTSPFTVDATAPNAVGTVTVTTPTGRTSSQPSAILINWPQPNPVPTDLAGFQIRYSQNVTPRVWQYTDVGEKTATSILVEGLSSNTGYVAQVRPYDQMINVPNWSAESAAGTSTTSTAPPQDISSTISILTGGTLRSGDYEPSSAPGVTPVVVGKGWSLQPTGLFLEQGTVNARIIRAGELRSNINVAAGLPDAGQPLWSLNTEGNMTVRNALVKGKIVVGNATGGSNNDLAIASATYGIGTQNQWTIRGDGTFEIRSRDTVNNTKTVVLDSTGLRASDGTTITTNIKSDGTFAFTTPASTASLTFDSTGLKLVQGATTKVKIGTDGNAEFAGKITADTGLIGGWDINGTYLYKNSLYLDASTGSIFSGSGASKVGMRGGYGFWAGSENHWDNAPFKVSTNGYLQSTSGIIGGWTIGPTSLSGAGTITGGHITSTTITASALRSSAEGTYHTAMGAVTNHGRGMFWLNSSGGAVGYIKLEGTWERPRGVGQFSTMYRLRMGAADGVYVENASLDVGYSIYAGGNIKADGEVWDSGYRVYSPVNVPPTHSHPYYSSSGGTLSGNLSATGYVQAGSGQGVYAGGHLMVNDSGYPTLFNAGSNTRIGVQGQYNDVYLQTKDAQYYVTVYAATFTPQSSGIVKEDVRAAPSALSVVKKMRPVTFKRTGGKGRYERGLIAEEIREIDPLLAVDIPACDPNNPNEKPTIGLDLTGLAATALHAVKELSEEVDKLRSRLAELEAK